MKRWLGLLLLAACGCQTPQAPEAPRPHPSPAVVAVIPRPGSLEAGKGAFRLTKGTAIVCDPAFVQEGQQLAELLRPATGFALKARTGLRPLSPFVALRSKPGLGPEGYELKVTPGSVTISATTENGAFYGVQTFLQLLPPEIYGLSVAKVAWEAPAVRIRDHPRFSWRGCHLDCSRHFMPKQFVKKFIRLLAMHKLNRFHWHLSDDQGWRLQIRRYPRLTGVGAPGGFYTQEDVKDIVACARRNFVTIVPEIDMPGHCQALLAAYPQLGCTPDRLAPKTTWGVSPYLVNPSDDTVQFLQNVLAEVMELFPGQWVHVGGDEAGKAQWKANPRLKELGLHSEDELQSWFLKQMDDFLARGGRKMIGWDEILDGGLPGHAAVTNWHDFERTLKIADQGHDVILATPAYTYFDFYQSSDVLHEPLALTGYAPLERVYNWLPLPADLSRQRSKHILGIQGQLWSEFMPDSKAVEYMAFPRLTALAEVAWTADDHRDFAEFKQRLNVHLNRLALLDVHFRPLDP